MLICVMFVFDILIFVIKLLDVDIKFINDVSWS